MYSKKIPFISEYCNKNAIFIAAIAFLVFNPILFIDWSERPPADISKNLELEKIESEEFSVEEFIGFSPAGSPEEIPAPAALYLNLTNGSFQYPAGSTITPFGNTQNEAQLRTAYKVLFERIYTSSDIEIVMAQFKYGSVEYPAGTMASMGSFGGMFNYTVAAEAFNITAGLALHPKKIAVFKSEEKDSYGQNITWEEGYFERIFRVYLWGDYFDVVNETDINKGELLNYEILIMPGVTRDYEKKVVNKLGSGGLAKLRQFVRKGNMLYAQGGSGYIAEQAWLIPNGTVKLDERIEANNNHADLTPVNSSSIMTMNWLKDQMYLLDDPLLVATDPDAVVARYKGNLSNSSHINSPAIMEFDYKNGQVIITNGHPSVNNQFYPIVFNALLTAMAEPPDIRAFANQIYNDEVASDLIPAQEPDIPVEVTVKYLNFWPEPSDKKINLTETIQPAFYLDAVNITPTPHSIWNNSLGQTMVSWEFADAQGINTFNFIVRTFDNTTKKGVAHICSGVARYEPIGYKGKTEIHHPHVTIRAALAARLVGDRDIELDGCYPLPASGFYFDIAMPLENKEETDARNITIVDIVCLKSPVVDVDNQTRVPDAVNNTNNGTSNPVFAINDIFYYYDKHGNPMYPMPDEEINTTYTYQFGNNGTNITLPAKKLVWYYPNIIPYDYQEPAIRYGIFTHEEYDRTVSFLSSPVKNSVLLNASGGSVFTNLGIHPVPYHEYLSHGVVTIPKGDEIPRVDYRDIWNRNHTMELRTVFYDIVPFPPPEEHAVVTTTFEMTHDGERLKEFPVHHEVELNFTIKTWNGYGIYNASSYPYHMDLHKNETMIVQAIPRGVGYNIDYIKSIFNENTSLVKIENTSTHTILYFQQYIEGGHKEVINVNANLSTYPEVHREGRMKINDGARFVYHQIAVGPSRYEVFDSHVQAVFGISNDVTVKKKVAPVYIATFGDDVYHFIRLEDPYEPREFMEDPYIKSYGFGEITATTYVGGRTNDTIHRSRVEPGDKTLLRLEVCNNLGVDLEDVKITPVAPEGFRIVPDTFTTEVPPIFYDFPFINRTDIWDAWKSVYYWWIHVNESVPGGEVYQINFTFECDSTNASYLPSDFEIPPALVGVVDEGGHVEAIFGRAVNLTLMDTMTQISRAEDVRIANIDEKAALELMLATGVSRPGYYNRSIVNDSFSLLRQASFSDLGGGKIDIDLPDYAEMLPWLDNNSDEKTLYVIVRTNVTVQSGGTYVVNKGAEVSYRNHFNETVEVKCGGEYIEAHGPAFKYGLNIFGIRAGGQSYGYLSWGENNTVSTKVSVFNYGDDIALSSVVVVKVPSHVDIDGALLPAGAYTVGRTIHWKTGDIGPGSLKSIVLTLYTTPPSRSLMQDRGPPDPWMMIEYAQIKFVHGFLYKPVTVPASQPLYGQMFDSDMKLNRIHCSHPFAATNHEHTVYAEVSSNWPYTEDIFDVLVNFSVNGVFAGTGTIKTLAAGEMASCGIAYTFTSEGTYDIFAEIVGPDMNEFFSDNNNLSAELVVVDAVTLSSEPDFDTGIDTFIASGESDTVFGDRYNLKVGTAGSSGGPGSGIGINRMVLKFDTRGIPSNALILDAKLQLYMLKSVGGTIPVSAYPLLHPWQESVTWDSMPANGSTAITTSSIDSITGYKSWNITTALRSWLAYPDTNFGMVLASDRESYYWYKEFYSSDTENGLRPKLVLHYAMLKNTPDVSDVVVEIVDFKDKELRLEWTPVPYALYYEIYSSDSASGPFSKLGETWSYATQGGNGSLNNFFYDDVDGGYPEPPSIIATDRGGQPGTIRVYWTAANDPAMSTTYYYRIKAIGVEGQTSSQTGPVPGQLTPTITKYLIYNSTSSSGPWTQILGETADTEYLHVNLGQGKYMYYRIRSESSEGYQSVLSKLVLGRSNRAPSASGPYISPDPAYTLDHLYAKYTFSDPDGDADSGSMIRWYRDGNLISAFNDKPYVYYWWTKKNEVWYYTITPKDGIEYGIPLNSGQITIKNTLPKLTNVVLTPVGPSTADPLTIGYRYYDADSDAETGTQIHWYRNGVHMTKYDGATEIPSSDTVKGEAWNASIRSSDGTAYCDWEATGSVTIKNTAPEASGVNVSPLNPTTVDALTAVYTYSDLDKDVESGTRLYWYRDNQLQTAFNDKTVIPASATSKGEEWYFAVIPHDGEDAGVKVTSSKVKIDNSAPEITELRLYPEDPRTGDTLSIWYTYYDSDQDAESGTVIKWYRNDVFVSELENKNQVPPAYTGRGDAWQYTVTPNDGYNFGITYYSDTIYILNTAPLITYAGIIPAAPALDDDLAITYEFEDPDFDEVVELEVIWFRDTEPVPLLSGELKVSSAQTQAGESWFAEIMAGDGFDFGGPYITEVVKINTPPHALNAYISPGSANTLDELVANYEWKDADPDDTESGTTITWYRDGSVVPELADVSIVTPSMTKKGQIWFFVVTPCDGSDPGEMLPSPPVVIENSAPTASDLAIIPAEPGSEDQLTAQYEYSDPDGDKEVGTSITWYRNDEQVPELDDKFIVPSSMLVPEDVWYYVLRPSDGESSGEDLTSGSVKISIKTVVVDDAYILPEDPTTESTLEAQVTLRHQVTGKDHVLDYSWYRNDVLQKELDGRDSIAPGYTAKGETWYFTVSVFDGSAWSEPVRSRSVMIRNTRPVVETVLLSPNPALTSKELTATYEFIDDDDDVDTDTEIRWYRNDEPVSELNDLRSVPVSYLISGDEWYCSISPGDGEAHGSMVTSNYVKVNHRPEVRSVQVSPKTPDDSDTLVLEYTFFDTDGDLDILTNIKWYRNGVHMPEHDGDKMISTRSTLPGESWYAVVIPHDGLEFGDEALSNKVTISSSAAFDAEDGSDTTDKSSLLSSPLTWVVTIIILMILAVLMLVLRRSKRLRLTSKASVDPILTIEDAVAQADGREFGHGLPYYTGSGLHEPADTGQVMYAEELSDLDVPRFVGLEHVLAMEEAHPCGGCDGDMEGDLERCKNCHYELHNEEH